MFVTCNSHLIIKSQDKHQHQHQHQHQRHRRPPPPYHHHHHRLSQTMSLLLLLGVLCLSPTPTFTVAAAAAAVGEGEDVAAAVGEVYVLALQHGYHALADNPRHRRRRSLSTGNLGGTPGQGYYVRMGIGTPQQMFNVLIDTGSSNFALAAAPHDDVEHFFNSSKSSTFEDIGTEVYVPYTKGDWHGYLGRDEVTIVALPNVTVAADFALIDEASEFYINGSDWQGILGMGYAEIARPDDSVVPFFDALIEQKSMKAVFSMQLCGMVRIEEDSGEMAMGGTLVLGGTDDDLYDGDILFARLNKEWYYEVIMTDISVDGRSVGLPCKEYNFDKTIVDSGTTNFRLPNTVFDAVTSMIDSYTRLLLQNVAHDFWTGEDVLCWPPGLVPWQSFPALTLSIAHSENTTFELVVSPRQYLRPVADSGGGLGEAAEECYKYAIVPSETGAVIGAVIMEGYYVIFDRQNKRIGFADSTCKSRNADEFNSKVGDYRIVRFNTTECAYYKVDNDRWSLLVVAYVLAGICGMCLLLLLTMMMQWQVQKCRRLHRGGAGAGGDAGYDAAPDTQLIEERNPSLSSSSSSSMPPQ